ncbi:MAG: endo alpha-1,4 polygalactosaminidase [Clostridiales bacterium]|nr:endo alpha-1,4 polygalactosaminidase [Clostridiales bacterium]
MKIAAEVSGQSGGKSVAAVLLVLAMILSLAGCGKEEFSEKKGKNSRKEPVKTNSTASDSDRKALSDADPVDGSIAGTADGSDFGDLELSDIYLVGYDYSTYSIYDNDPVCVLRVRYDKRIEADFNHSLSNGTTRKETVLFELTDEQFENMRNGIDLEELYELDPEELDPDEVYDGGSCWLFIYGKDDQILKDCGGFCPQNKRFSEMRQVVRENLPQEFFDAYCSFRDKEHFCRDYGRDYEVLLSVEDLSQFDFGYGQTVVIDAQNFPEEEIWKLKNQEVYVLSYLNIGSIEDFRPYYEEYADLALGDYEHWDEEKWVDVTSARWQSFILEELVPEMIAKGCDGFFVDNCDVYYVYPSDAMLDAVAAIMRGLVATGKVVIMNGGDSFIDAYTEMRGDWWDVITGINQETVFTKIDWDAGELRARKTDDEDFLFFTDYVERYAEMGVYIYLLEYTQNAGIEQKIRDYCLDHDFVYYISDSIELDG